MNSHPKIPDAATRSRNIQKWREVNRQLDALTLTLDELIAMVEAHNRQNSLVRHRLGQSLAPTLPETDPG